jgi:curli biogenesis system outer membrane secretion channel CsgG
MNSRRFSWSRTVMALILALALTAGLAQDRAIALEPNPVCKAMVATVMVGKVTCTAALCNTGAAQGGFTGLLAQAINRGAIDGASFSTGVGAQLATALKQTGCFEVFDSASLDEIRKEMEALGKPAPPPRSADYVIRASITKADLALEESGFLAYKKTTATSSLTLDTKLVSVQQGTVMDASSYDATSQRSSSGLSLGIYNSNDDAAKRGTPFSDVARDVVVKAATGIAARILSQLEASRPTGASSAPPAPQQLPASAPL